MRFAQRTEDSGLRTERYSIPSQHSLYDRFAPLYAEFRLHRFHDDRAEVAAALDLSGARRVLELGCGPGFYATAFARQYPRLIATGLDRAPGQIAIARRRAGGVANLRYVVGDARAITEPDGAYDRVLASRLLMVVPEREAVLAEARRVLAPGGILLLAEPTRRAGMLGLLREAASRSGEATAYVEPWREHYFTAAGFRAFVAGYRWASVAIWEANDYRYARCRATTQGDGLDERARR